MSYEQRMEVIRSVEQKLEEDTKWLESSRKDFWEIEEHRPRLLKENVQWALDFEVNERILEYSPYEDPICGTLLKGINQTITKDTKKLMETMMIKTSIHGQWILDFQKFKLANTIVDQKVSHPEYQNIDLMAIVVKASLLAQCFYKETKDLGRAPRSSAERRKELFQMIEDFRFEHIIPASMILACELIGEEPPEETDFGAVHEHIIMMCPPEEAQDIRKHYKIMRMNTQLCSMDKDPISEIVNYPRIPNEVKQKAIGTLMNILEAGAITNPSASSLSIARMAIDKSIKDLEGMDNTKPFNKYPSMDQNVKSKDVVPPQPSCSNLTMPSCKSVHENDNPRQSSEVYPNMNVLQQCNSNYNIEKLGV